MHYLFCRTMKKWKLDHPEKKISRNSMNGIVLATLGINPSVFLGTNGKNKFRKK